MNTMPQALDERPIFRPAPATVPRRPDHLKLVVDRSAPMHFSVAAVAQPYGLNGRRHLAHVPDAGSLPAAQVQAPAAEADTKGSRWTLRRLEPMAFALVLLLSVATWAAAVRVG